MSTTRDYASRYEAELERRAARLLGEPEPDTYELPANMPQPLPVHRAIMGAVDRVLTMGLTGPNQEVVPLQMRTFVRLLRRMEPLILEHLAKLPEEECLKMMRSLAAGINQLADSVDPVDGPSLAPDVAEPRADLAQAT